MTHAIFAEDGGNWVSDSERNTKPRLSLIRLLVPRVLDSMALQLLRYRGQWKWLPVGARFLFGIESPYPRLVVRAVLRQWWRTVRDESKRKTQDADEQWEHVENVLVRENYERMAEAWTDFLVAHVHPDEAGLHRLDDAWSLRYVPPPNEIAGETDHDLWASVINADAVDEFIPRRLGDRAAWFSKLAHRWACVHRQTTLGCWTLGRCVSGKTIDACGRVLEEETKAVARTLFVDEGGAAAMWRAHPLTHYHVLREIVWFRGVLTDALFLQSDGRWMRHHVKKPSDVSIVEGIVDDLVGQFWSSSSTAWSRLRRSAEQASRRDPFTYHRSVRRVVERVFRPHVWIGAWDDPPIGSTNPVQLRAVLANDAESQVEHHTNSIIPSDDDVVIEDLEE